jgi:hypothetical protein
MPNSHDKRGLAPSLTQAEQRASSVLSELARTLPNEGMTLGELLTQLGERGELMACMLLTVPFLLPLSIPGSSIPFGLLIALHGLGILMHRVPWLPEEPIGPPLDSAAPRGLADERRAVVQPFGTVHPPTATPVDTGGDPQACQWAAAGAEWPAIDGTVAAAIL